VIEVRSRTDDDLRWATNLLRAGFGSTRVARLGGVIDAGPLDGLVALDAGARVGLLTFTVDGDAMEVVTLQSDQEGRGVGTALMDAAQEQARKMGCRRLWLVTTNDNTRALRFYQRWGMDLVALHRDGVTRARQLKLEIPALGSDGIPLRHELELALELANSDVTAG
jgi:ribosomal protein S18 acetylase RimI-like enzyme